MKITYCNTIRFKSPIFYTRTYFRQDYYTFINMRSRKNRTKYNALITLFSMSRLSSCSFVWYGQWVIVWYNETCYTEFKFIFEWNKIKIVRDYRSLLTLINRNLSSRPRCPILKVKFMHNRYDSILEKSCMRRSPLLFARFSCTNKYTFIPDMRTALVDVYEHKISSGVVQTHD